MEYETQKNYCRIVEEMFGSEGSHNLLHVALIVHFMEPLQLQQ